MKKLARLLTILFVLFLIAVPFSPAFAQTPTPTTPTSPVVTTSPELPFTDFNGFLLWLISGPGLVAAVGATISFGLGKLKRWNALDGDLKLIICWIALPGIFLVPGFYAAIHFGLILPEEIPNRVLGALIFFLFSQITYGRMKARGQLRLPTPKPA